MIAPRIVVDGLFRIHQHVLFSGASTVKPGDAADDRWEVIEYLQGRSPQAFRQLTQGSSTSRFIIT
jgi:hypothetical protein